MEIEVTPAPELAIPVAELTEAELTAAVVGAAKAYDYENRPQGRDWTAVPFDQVARIVTGALKAMEFEPAPKLAGDIRERVTEALRECEVEVVDGGDRAFFTTLADPGHVAATVLAEIVNPTAEDYDHAAEIMRLRGQLQAVRVIAEPYAGEARFGASSTTVLAQAIIEQLDPE